MRAARATSALGISEGLGDRQGVQERFSHGEDPEALSVAVARALVLGEVRIPPVSESAPADLSWAIWTPSGAG